MSSQLELQPRRRDHAPLPVLPVADTLGSFGMALFVTTESALFVLMFAAYYYLDHRNPQWRAEVPPPVHYALWMLAVLIAINVCLSFGQRRVAAARRRAGRVLVLVTLGLSALFLVLNFRDMGEHLLHLTPSTDSYGSIFYTITGVHLAHVFIGIGMLIWLVLLPRWEPAQYPPHRPYHNVAIYWWFMTAAWAAILLLLYVAPHG